MNKAVAVVAGAIVLVAAGWTGTSWYTGKRVQQEIEQYVRALNDRPGLGKVTIESYDRGVFASSARYRFTAGPLPLPLDLIPPGDEIVFEGDIHHGPWPWQRLRVGEFRPVLAASRTHLVNTGPVRVWYTAARGDMPFEERSVIHYDGSIDFTGRFSSLLLEAPGVLIKSEGGFVRGHAGPGGESLELTGTFGDVQLQSQLVEQSDEQPFDLLLKGTSLAISSQEGRFGLYPGTAQISIEEVRIHTVDESGEPVEVRVEDYKVSGALRENDTFIQGSVAYEVGQVMVSDVPLGSIALNMQIDRLDGKAVQAMLHRYREVLPAILEQEQKDASSSQVPPALEAWVNESLQVLLPSEPTLSIEDFRWALNDAASHFRMRITLQPVSSTESASILDGIKEAIAELVLSREMVVELMTRLERMPENLQPASPEQARAAAQVSFELLQQLALSSGYATLENGNLVARLKYENGVTTVNGKDIPLEELLGLIAED